MVRVGAIFSYQRKGHVADRVEWNAEHYHEVSRPHEVWGAGVLDRIPDRDISVAIDAGCGTGKITRDLLERLSTATVYALDVSPAMLAVAERELGPIYGDRVRFRHADLISVTPDQIGPAADLIFSTATFHWVRDHDLLFRRLFALLQPGGQVVAQCGGGPNIERLRGRVDTLMRSPEFAPHFRDWVDSWYFAGAEETADRLASAGFVDVRTGVEFHPAQMPDADEYRSFVSTVILREQLARLPDDGLRSTFLDALVSQAAMDDPPYELDYWRLNLMATRPRRA